MARWIELTGYADKKMLVNADQIIAVKPCENRDVNAEIDTTDGTHLLVKETYEQVMWLLGAEDER